MASHIMARLADILKNETAPNKMIIEILPESFLAVMIPLRQAIIFLIKTNPIIIHPATKSSSFIDLM